MCYFTVFYFSKIIYHSEEEGDLDTFVYIFRHPSHSSSFCLYPKLSKARVIVVGGEWNRAYAHRGTYAQIFLRFGLSFFCRGWGGYLQGSFISIFTAYWYHCYTHLNDLISWPLYVYYEKTALKYVYPQKWTCTPKWKHQGVHVPPNRNMSGHAVSKKK